MRKWSVGGLVDGVANSLALLGVVQVGPEHGAVAVVLEGVGGVEPAAAGDGAGAIAGGGVAALFGAGDVELELGLLGAVPALVNLCVRAGGEPQAATTLNMPTEKPLLMHFIPNRRVPAKPESPRPTGPLEIADYRHQRSPWPKVQKGPRMRVKMRY